MGRVDGPDKVGGNTVYTADVQLPGMLWGNVYAAPTLMRGLFPSTLNRPKRSKA